MACQRGGEQLCDRRHSAGEHREGTGPTQRTGVLVAVHRGPDDLQPGRGVRLAHGQIAQIARQLVVVGSRLSSRPVVDRDQRPQGESVDGVSAGVQPTPQRAGHDGKCDVVGRAAVAGAGPADVASLDGNQRHAPCG